MIKIEVTGNSIGEVADKLLAIGGSLRSAAPSSQTIQAPFIPLDPVMPEVAEMAVVTEPVGNDVAATAADPSPTTTSEEATSSASPATSPSEPPASEELFFEVDVAPLVLQVVKEKGKPAAQEILSQFGVEKASAIDPAQWPELIEALKGAL
jgi:hypothetical protein